jgi:hypothetical protein
MNGNRALRSQNHALDARQDWIGSAKKRWRKKMPESSDGQKPEIDIEESMLLAYKFIFGIDPLDCVKIEEPWEALEIKVKDQKIPLNEFFDSGSIYVRTVAIDHYSTKEVNDKIVNMLNPGPLRELYKKLYLELTRMWGVVEYQKENVGVTNRIHLYNGFPIELDIEKVAKDPGKANKEVVEELMKTGRSISSITEILFSKPKISEKRKLALHKTFLTNYPISEKTK